MLWRVGESLVRKYRNKIALRASNEVMDKQAKTKKRGSAAETHIQTKVGKLKRIGTTPWGKPQVACPQCGQPATAGKSGDVWCRACGFDTATLVGCT